MSLRPLLVIVLSAILASSPVGGAIAQDTPTGAAARPHTGGAQTLEDIMARQRGEVVDYGFRSGNTGDPAQAAAANQQLGTLGGVSDADVWRSVRFSSSSIIASTDTPVSRLMIQDDGMTWLSLRAGPLRSYGGYLLLAVIGLLVVFYLLRGKIRIEGRKTGESILRFSLIERVAHWALAGSFVLLAITGLITLFGRVAFIPLIGRDAFSWIAAPSKWIHNNVSWVFMVSLVVVFLFWIRHNIPNRADLVWLAKGGGLFTKGTHPPARKFNAGQKIIYWLVLIMGASISASGLALLFPFEFPMFAATFVKLNAFGIPGLFGMEPLPEVLSPYQEMQLSLLWHGIVAFVFIAVIIAHIYLGSVGMEGAFAAMGTGKVDKQWAKEHHSLWYNEVVEAEKSDSTEDRPVPEGAS